MYLKKILILSLLLVFSGQNLFAQEKTIVIAKSSELPAFESLLEGFEDSLNNEHISYKIIDYDLSDQVPEDVIKADLIFTIGTRATRILSKRFTNAPIVFSMVMAPDFSEQNITGVLIEVPPSKQINVLSKINPKPKKIGILYDPKKTKKLVETYTEEFREKGFEVLSKEINSIDEVYGAIRAFRPSIDCLLIIPDTTVYSVKSTEDIILYSLREGLPVIGISPSYVKAGALFAISCNYNQIGRRSGTIAARILRGEKPSEIPYSSPDKFDLSINLIVADRIGIAFPDKLVKEANNVFK